MVLYQKGTSFKEGGSSFCFSVRTSRFQQISEEIHRGPHVLNTRNEQQGSPSESRTGVCARPKHPSRFLRPRALAAAACRRRAASRGAALPSPSVSVEEAPSAKPGVSEGRQSDAGPGPDRGRSPALSESPAPGPPDRGHRRRHVSPDLRRAAARGLFFPFRCAQAASGPVAGRAHRPPARAARARRRLTAVTAVVSAEASSFPIM